MSFGAVSPSHGRRPAPGSRCVCGSGDAFAACCGPVLDGEAAPTAEALMRSRYSAFALGDGAHLLASWHPATRPDRLELDAQTDWRGLEILSTEQGRAGDTRGVVSFRARWADRSSGDRGVLAETSRFRLVDGRWTYLDGVVDRRSV
ncbi:SEC-C domain-containing protein [Microbacterium hominis]|uniref:YchJ family protein n=1 Tax=Microbacterium TaxID=33882 RepID=UPI00168BF117|nr:MULTISPECIES: YchJ family metal-binding protein [Microbacterium]QOC25726.1 SEC-C domain-containing protein [Microbacterium hominis]QOC29715.1 SEC-C domain-containing protein [Microbacterium hominis]QYF97900.1 SEC-C domain-containing protein [Microbacterium sp. PAMC21962]